MPGMMDTVLSLGINEEVAAALAEKVRILSTYHVPCSPHTAYMSILANRVKFPIACRARTLVGHTTRTAASSRSVLALLPVF